MDMKIPPDDFMHVLKNTVLVSLDLLVTNARGEVLVGERTNPPAAGYLFAPGGRIIKGETIEQALERISITEIGVRFDRTQALLLGIYDHIYEDNVFNQPNFGTQYVVIACHIEVPISLTFKEDSQHRHLRMMSVSELLENPKTHPYLRNYFYDNPNNLFLRGIESIARLRQN